jgi:alkylation response protein AidB-like acyl-CoA dehydrogenase
MTHPKLSHADWLGRAETLAPWLTARTAQIEATRSLPPEVADALADAGFHGLLTPRDCGGPELHVASFFEVIERLARADAASAWCAFISSTAGVLAAYMPAAAAAPIFGRAGVRLAGVFAPRGLAEPALQDGVSGWRVSGRWAWGSGVANAHFVSGGCRVAGSEGRALSMIFERQQLQWLDNWHSLGLCGTGSGDFEVHDAFVPAARAVDLFAAPQQDGPLYRFPVFGLLALGIAAVSAGIARSAIQALVDLAATQRPQDSRRTLAERPRVQAEVAQAEAALRSARAFVLEAVHAAWAVAERGGAMPLECRRDLRLAATHLVHSAAAVTARMYGAGGGSALMLASPLQRCLRDVNVATQHMMVADSSWELAGRLLLGLPTAHETL